MMHIDDDELIKLSTLDTIENHAAIIGMTGSGKTHFLKVLALELSADIKVTIVDPEGDYSDLRFSRKALVVGKGFPGQHIDIELTPGNAAAAADVLCHYDMPIVILNLSGFDIDEQDEFVLEYVGQLWKNYRFEEDLPPHRLIIDEVQLFAPQTEKTLSKFLLRDMARRARKRQLTLAVATQEPQAVYKPLLNASNYRIFLQVARGTAMDAIKRLLPVSVLNAPGKANVQDMIASMNKGDALFMVGNNAIRVHVRAGRTPVAGAGGQLPLDDGTLDKLRALIGANKRADDLKAEVKHEVEVDHCIEDLKAENEELKAEVQRLRNELAAAAVAERGVFTSPPAPLSVKIEGSTEQLYDPVVKNAIEASPYLTSSSALAAAGIQARDEQRQTQVEERERSRQNRGYQNLQLVIIHQTKLDRRILSYLVDHDPKEYDATDLRFAMGLSQDNHFSMTALTKSKLVSRRKVGIKYLYSTTILKTIAEQYPLIDRTEAVEAIARIAAK